MDRHDADEIVYSPHSDKNSQAHDHDGIDRRGFLKCMAWVGTGTFCVMRGGVLKSYSLGSPFFRGHDHDGELSFVQISDSHMGFDRPANTDVVGTFRTALILSIAEAKAFFQYRFMGRRRSSLPRHHRRQLQGRA